MQPEFSLLDYGGVAVFAATGALAASRKQLDIIGFLFLATITGIGGGTFRDLILAVPVFWVANPDFVTDFGGYRDHRLFRRPPAGIPLQDAALARRDRPRRFCGDGGGEGAHRHRVARRSR